MRWSATTMRTLKAPPWVCPREPDSQRLRYPDKTIAVGMVAWLLMSLARGVLVEWGALPEATEALTSLLCGVRHRGGLRLAGEAPPNVRW